MLLSLRLKLTQEIIKKATTNLPKKLVTEAIVEVIEALDGLYEEEDNEDSMEEDDVNSIAFDVADEYVEEQVDEEVFAKEERKERNFKRIKVVIDIEDGDLVDEKEYVAKQVTQLDEQATLAQFSEPTIECVEKEAEEQLEEQFLFPTSSTQKSLSPIPVSMKPLIIPPQTTSKSTTSTSTSDSDQTNLEIIPLLFVVGSSGTSRKGPTIEEIHIDQSQPPQ